MKRNRCLTFGLYIAFLATTALAADPVVSEPVRPTGIPTPPEKSDEAKPKTKPKAKPKTTRHRAKDDDDDIGPAATLPNGVPVTKARSIMMVDAKSGQILYEKNADELRAAASTQKLLTALIVAEGGYLDRTVTVEQVD